MAPNLIKVFREIFFEEVTLSKDLREVSYLTVKVVWGEDSILGRVKATHLKAIRQE